MTLLLITNNNKGGSHSSVLPSTSLAGEHDGNKALFYNKQILDHFGDDNSSVWSHRYYKSIKHFGGPGHPIFLAVGGEGAFDHGMLYPFVTDVLTKRFGAAVVQPEHRFYGPYQPVANATVDELLQLLTPQQAMADMIRLVTHHLSKTVFEGCSPDRASPAYCPLITVGGSYPGFLSAMFRLVYPDVVDAAYASAAPFYMYDQRSDPNAYYDIVTAVAEHASPGCPYAMKQTLLDVVDEIMAAASLQEAAAHVGICDDLIPDHITTKEMLSDALVQITSYSFADHDMDCYPSGPDTGLSKVCKLFQDPKFNTIDTMRAFFDSLLIQQVEEEAGCDMPTVQCNPEEELQIVRDANEGRDCFDLNTQDPDGTDSAVEGTMWDFQTCTTVIFLAGLSETSMFPAHNATYADLTKECHKSFGNGVTPRPREVADLWGFDDLVKQGASHILFTNGGHDMCWSGGGVLEDLSDSLLALNFANGAHHSDLSHEGPSDKDTDDIKEGFVKIADILGNWLDEIREEDGI